VRRDYKAIGIWLEQLHLTERDSTERGRDVEGDDEGVRVGVDLCSYLNDKASKISY